MTEALRICQNCTKKHYENCPQCFGFGVYVQEIAIAGGGFREMLVPISAHEAYVKSFRNTPEKCPVCKSTHEGMPK